VTNYWSCKNCRLLLAFIMVVTSLSSACVFAGYPDKPITFVVGFGIGGSADRMVRVLSPYIASELGQPVRVINKPGASTQVAANYVLAQANDGYTVFASTFNPYLHNSIVQGGAKYKVGDFAFINAQWSDFELIAVNKNSGYETLSGLLEAIKNNPKQVRASVLRGSMGELVVKLLLTKLGIPANNLNLVTYNSGGKARAVVSGHVVDFTVISATGSEGIREFIRPLAVVRQKESKDWKAPTVNEALKPLGISIPVMQGSLRGYAVPMAMKIQHPERFNTLSEAIRKALSREDVQKALKEKNIGGDWTGYDSTQQVMIETYDIFEQFHQYEKNKK